MLLWGDFPLIGVTYSRIVFSLEDGLLNSKVRKAHEISSGAVKTKDTGLPSFLSMSNARVSAGSK